MAPVVTAPSATLAPGTWQIDPAHSLVEFAVRHLMISTVKGRFGDVAGTIQIDGNDPAKSVVDVTINVASIDTREPQRDTHLRSADFFDVDRFPTLRFRSTRVSGGPGQLLVTGDLTIRDVTREVTLTVTPEGQGKDPWGGERAGYSAKGKINRSDFGLTWNQVLEAGGVVVGEEIKISIDVEFVKQAAK
jgi:polyisoprenoid-binding protein YceI